jgi:CMP/dCMP kinase
MKSRSIIIAIDGYSACGKSTLARALAAKLHFWGPDNDASSKNLVSRLDDIKVDFEFNSDTGNSETLLNGENVEKHIRSMEVSSVVSEVSKIPEIRKRMIALQRKMGERKSLVMDGRDIGTNVFPGAELKIFMTAEPEIRAMRRKDELTAKGIHIDMDEVRKNLELRDFEDSNRKENPLRQASDAYVLDNSSLTPEEQLNYVLKIMRDLKFIEEPKPA